MSLIKTEELGYFVGGFVGEGLDHPECVSAGKDGEAYAGGEEGQVYRIDTNDKTFKQLGSTGAFVGGIAQDGEGSVYCCCGPDIVKMTKDDREANDKLSIQRKSSGVRWRGVGAEWGLRGIAALTEASVPP